MLSSLLMYPMERIPRLLVAASLIGATAFLVTYLWHQWDSPVWEKREIAGEIHYKEPIEVKISCQCPTELVESKIAYVTFNLSSRWKFSRSDLPADQIYVYADDSGATIEPSGMIAAADTAQLSSIEPSVQSIPLRITPNITGPSQITFHFVRYSDTHGQQIPDQRQNTSPLGSIVWDINFRPSFGTSVAPLALSVLVFFSAGGLFIWIDQRQRRITERNEEKVKDAKDQWEKAQIKLETYFDANLFQVGLVFWIAVVVMAIGFCFVLWGLLLSLRQTSALTSTSGISVGAGIITEFIGATFMVIYRSTVAQANEFVTVLERTNRLGIAIQILDSIPEANGDLKAQARAQVAAAVAEAKLTSTEPKPDHPGRQGDQKK